MKHELKDTVKEYVESQELSSEQLQNLTNILNQKHKANQGKMLTKARSIAAVLVLSIALAVLWVVGDNNQIDMSRLIAEEVSTNHLKMKPMEVSSASLDDMRSYFNNLDFLLTTSQFVMRNNLQLVGGRYCSIQGETAAQLRMRDKNTGNIQIVYQAPYSQELFRGLPNLQEGQDPVRHFVNGVGVDVWVEKGILFARSFEQ